jgi:hypothetical protein
VAKERPTTADVEDWATELDAVAGCATALVAAPAIAAPVHPRRPPRLN